LVALLFIETGFAQSLGHTQRVANTTLTLPTAAPRYSYSTTNAFPELNFFNSVAIAVPPGETNRLFVVEQQGTIAIITNLAAPTYRVFLDISERVTAAEEGEFGFLGLAFHPGYATNRQFFAFYTTTTISPASEGQSLLHRRLSRFEVSSVDPNQAVAGSEVPLLTMLAASGIHNGGDLHFGPDGYLYVSHGDGGRFTDSAQMIDRDFASGILRIDVDNRSDNLEPNPHPAINPGTYRIPRDNPFIGITNWQGRHLVPSQVRTEFYAVGLRNPWRMSFDPANGRLYCGDVGGVQREEVNIITKGGNYGWAFREGRLPGLAETPPGATSLDPIWEYTTGGNDGGNAVIGGVVYRGWQDPYLYGAYVFGDFNGKVWTLRHDGNGTTDFRLLTTDSRISAFGIDPRNGDILFLQRNQVSSTIRRLVANQLDGDPFPATLADTGAFQNLTNLQPNAGFSPYAINLPQWTDRAEATHWFYVPPASTIGFSTFSTWSFPVGSVLIQHFNLEMTNGMPESRRKVETRLLVQKTPTQSYGLSYRWDEAQTNANLVTEDGLVDHFATCDGGILRTQIWRYSGVQECRQCHNVGSGILQTLGFNTVQLNRDFVYQGGVTNNQILGLSQAGYFAFPLSEEAMNRLRFLARPDDTAASAEFRARSYFAVNCACCHQPGLTRSGRFDARLLFPISRTGLINGALNDSLGDPDSKVIAPGSPGHSMLLKRMTGNGFTRMPPLSGPTMDTQAVAVVEQWIDRDLPGYQTFADWQNTYFSSTNAPGTGQGEDPDSDGARNGLEYLTMTNPLEAGDGWRIHVERHDDQVVLVYPRLANRIFEIQSNTNPLDPSLWQTLMAPENRPFPSSTNGPTRVTVNIREADTRFYRVRVIEP
jgi:glucose/arabinose dehydrogenase